jgi:isoleucyl-tRNA synthetase
MLGLRGEISIALEEQRRIKTIGHSLDAAVRITALDEADYGFLLKRIALLKNLSIVSQVQAAPPAPGEKPSARKIEVTKASGAKCDRCWTYDDETGKDPERPGLCPRCADVVRRMG